ncbi:glycoside hydrolase family 88 protein [Olsenella sp. YH-ols2217]|uniref:Glycoside hydrolase family 88 protein n=1 Tax=Kribbibacterium absianum TaxID=3044210 RepID=A0ABT6ZN67_9ACTN|nr:MULTISPECIES: glycoside hydrolase family 88 protein [unclassified Olsenella]MDJ1122269.1 glycoside hydrolase family 88 protein [Olsenella sp. YH-ols2216]MDJ1130317.1 glycoside hydrolase family 88 protein [Olsenella sp. YH-ols2217]
MGCNAILDIYIEQLLDRSTPEAPAWNIEKARAGGQNTWNYIDGCMIKALLELSDITGRQDYRDYADAFIDHFVGDDGAIDGYDPEEYNLDNVNAGKTLFLLHGLTGKEKYRLAMDRIYGQLLGQPRTKEGVFWHKAIYPNQIWLDGMYMAQPFYMQYELAFNERRACSDSFHQFCVVRDLMRDARNGLYHHAYDSSRKQFWCDPVTGLSSSFWLRAEGWFAMALVDTWELMPPSMSTEKDTLRQMLAELVDAMLPYRDPATGMWHQVINLPNIEPNYLETSGSAIFANAMMKGARLGILDEGMFDLGRETFDGICRTCLTETDGELELSSICLVAGLGNTGHREGTFEYYMREPVVKNDAKGVAPLVLAYIETMRHDQLAGLCDPTSPAASCSLLDPFGGYEPHGTPVARSSKAV